MRLSQLDGLHVGIWGAGREGLAALAALTRRGGATSVLVYSEDPEDPGLEQARVAGATIAAGAQSWRELTRCEVVIRSPGVSLYRDEVAELRALEIPLTTGTNLWFSENEHVDTIAVTGTKGKSTTAALIAHLLRAAGEEALLAGNVGRPLLDRLGDGGAGTAWVLELSSFQIADLEHAPRIGVLLNLFDEHLDWHGDADRYHADKLRLFALQPPCTAVLCGADAGVVGLARPAGETVWYGTEQTLHVRDGAVWDGARRLKPPLRTPLLGAHNLLNLCAALTVLRLRGHVAGLAPGALESFKPLPHRLQLVGEHEGVRFVDDSISTTAQSTIAALAAFPGTPVALIAGGHDRGQDYTELAREIRAHGGVRAVAALPVTGPRLLAALQAAGADGPDLREARDLPDALAFARAALGGAGVVLLSPAAPSFGAYRDFEERGEHFATLVAASGASGKSGRRFASEKRAWPGRREPE
ncbi:MAG TPA: UDP-N-acetylmuramoyl-L-alanine--D-glutamate ligase [Solirubrobacteraceae bacterium]|nr:UDP-N-acetylmuramoyl-L-alanine--D-glutamate ligase [Solirubrobacteraceae bacterium]